MIAFLLKQ